MYVFSVADDLSFLLGDEAVLDTVTFGRFIIHFRLQNGVTISWEAAIEHICGDVVARLEPPWVKQGDLRLHTLLGQRIVRLDRADWTLTLTFETGDQLTLHSNAGFYEAGTISNEASHYVF